MTTYPQSHHLFCGRGFQIMKKLLSVASICILLIFMGCTEDDEIPTGPEKGHVSGKVVNTQGNALEGVDMVVNNSQFYNDNILGQTDANGNYKLEVTPGSWYVRATIDVPYDNQTYTLDLDPDNSKAFAGTEGAVRNFHWKLTGARPTDFGASGYYGGSVEIVGGWDFYDVEGVELTLTPIAPLIDGSNGQTITRNPDRDVLEDVPIGRYEISARYVPENRPMQIRIRNKDQAYASTVVGSFEPAYPGATENYKITVEVE